MFFEYMNTPLGEMRIEASRLGLTSAEFITVEQPQPEQPNPITQAAKSQLQAYFSAELYRFELPLAPVGTVFQQQVWQQLLTLECGKTCSYAELAAAVGKPKGAQAVGQANGRNPIAVIIPCHRVIGRNGSLTGYAGGLHRKAWLLEHEQKML